MATKAQTAKENTAKATTKSGKKAMIISINSDVNIANLEAKKVLLAQLTAEIETAEDKLKKSAIESWIEKFAEIKEYPASCTVQLENESGTFLLTPTLTAKLTKETADTINAAYPEAKLVLTETKKLETPKYNSTILKKYESKIVEFLKTCEDVTPEDLANLVITEETTYKIDTEVFKKPSFIHTNCKVDAYKKLVETTKVLGFQNKSFTPPSNLIVVANTALQTINVRETNIVVDEKDVMEVVAQ